MHAVEDEGLITRINEAVVEGRKEASVLMVVTIAAITREIH
jgi:hypothetical protein